MGVMPWKYWELTPDEMNVVAQAYNENKLEQMDLLVTHAYYVAAFTRARRLPDLKATLEKLHKQRKDQTAEEMLAAVKALNAAMGGNVIVEGGEA